MRLGCVRGAAMRVIRPRPQRRWRGIDQSRESSDGRNFARGHKDAENSGAGVGRNKLEEF